MPGEEELAYLTSHLRSYLNLQVEPEDVASAWAGLRPLIAAPTRRVASGRARNRGTAMLTRDYLLELSPAGLLTVAGGKWTTYRSMAVQAVNRAAEAGDLAPERASQTRHTPLAGGDGYQPDPGRLRRDYGLAEDSAPPPGPRVRDRRRRGRGTRGGRQPTWRPAGSAPPVPGGRGRTRRPP